MKYVLAVALLATWISSAPADTIKVLQLKGWPSYTLYNNIVAHAANYGPDAISYTTYTGTVTLATLNSYNPDVLVISNPSGGIVQYTTDENDAIISYLSQPDHGRGILGEGYVFNSIGDTRPHMFFMGPLFGFRDGINYTNMSLDGVFDILPQFASLELFNGFTSPFTSSGFLKGNIPDGHGWNAIDLNQAVVVAANPDSTAIISLYDGPSYRAIYVSVWMGYQGSTADERMIYNCWRAIYHGFPLANSISDLRVIQPSGWAAALVPRRTADALENSVPVPDSLLGDSATTFLNLGIVSTVPDTTVWGFAFAVDGEQAFVGSAAGSAVTGNLNVGPIRVKGGWHTLTGLLDPQGVVPEFLESNNRVDLQWLWHPPAVSRKSNSTNEAPPRAGSGARPNCDAFTFSRDLRYAWLVVAAPESTLDAYDLACYGDYFGPTQGLENLAKRTTLKTRTTSFVVGSFLDDRTVIYPALSDSAQSGPRGGYVLYTDDAKGRQSDDPRASWTGVLSPVGALAQVYEAYFDAGAHYHLELARLGGDAVAAFEVFDPGTGLVHAAGEGAASIPIAGTGVDSLEYVPTATGWHSIVVYVPRWSGADSVHYGFAWTRDQNIVGTGPNDLVRVNKLAGPFPNPLSNASRFVVSMASAGAASLTAYDLSGRRRGTIWSGRLPAGTNTIAWGTNNGGLRLAPGVYWASLQGPGWESRRRFVVLNP